MKNFINYYYHFYVSNIHLLDGRYFFTYGNDQYMFKLCFENAHLIEEIDELSKQLYYQDVFYHEIIYNKDNSIITYIDGKPYVMLKLSKVASLPVSLFDIKGKNYIQLNKKLNNLVLFNWTYLWENKIDYFEEQILTKKNEYFSLLPSFHYFIGLGENAILYVKEAINNEKKEYTDQLVASHKRFYKGFTLIDFYDPTNLIIDHKARDAAEYMKYSFLIKDYDISVIKDYLEKFELSRLGAHLLFGRLLFPSFYFDQLELVLTRNEYSNIHKLETRLEEYQLFLIDIFMILKEKYQIQEINWILKKM